MALRSIVGVSRAAVRRVPAPARTLAPTRGFQRTALAAGGGGNSNAVNPPFQRLPLPTEPLHEEHELVWHDGVAPEATIDFDVPHMSTGEGLTWWLGGFAFFFALYQLAKLTNPEGKRPGAKRELPPETTQALGNYKAEAEERGHQVVFR